MCRPGGTGPWRPRAGSPADSGGYPDGCMRCPACDDLESRVIDSRPAEHGTSIRRRRACEACGHRYTTYERVAHADVVRKRSGALEAFQPEKIRRGMAAALVDRPFSDEAIEAMVEEIELEIRRAGAPTDTEVIGAMVLARLRAVDETAYLRFASVYKDFEGAEDFERELARLEAELDSTPGTP